jgi:hypothetical protein
MEAIMTKLNIVSAPASGSLTITPDSVFAILLKAREFDVKVPQTDPDSGSNPSDDDSVDALEFGTDDNSMMTNKLIS